MPDSIKESYTIPSEHPSLAGHFPENPVVPGVVILEKVRLLLLQWRPDYRISKIMHVKFHHFLRPQQVFDVSLIEQSQRVIKFACQVNGTLLVAGKLEIVKTS